MYRVWGFCFVLFFILCVCAKPLDLTLIEVLFLLAFLMVSPSFRMFALTQAAQCAQKMLDITLRVSIPVCLGSVLTRKLWGSDKQGYATFINEAVHE